jgi:ABC-type transport system substrate-binding protein
MSPASLFTALAVRPFKLLAAAALVLAAAGCDNSPYASGATAQNTLFAAFTARSPRYLDPTASYSNNETPYTFSIYEPLYTYHYLKRPYTLVPKTALEVVQPKFFDKAGQPLPADAPGEAIAESVYDIRIKPGVLYAPHPAFAKDASGAYAYHAMARTQVGDKRSPWEFAQTGTRELVADDYVYAIKRQATTRIQAPVFATFAEHVVGLEDYGKLIKAEDKKLLAGRDPADPDKPFLDFRKFPLAGVQALDAHTLRIRLNGKYPQWSYWLAMPFTAPVPWEADAFYAQPGMSRNGLSLNTWPVGTGPYMMSEYVQDRRHVMVRNPHYRADPYPCEGMPGDRQAGLLDDCGKNMPFIDKLVFTNEKEAVSLTAKFRQGYLDVPEIERPEYGVTFSVEAEDSDTRAREYKDKGFKLPKTVDISSWYLGFNWLDPVVGQGDTPDQQLRNRKLRQALSIAIDWEERSRIFPKDAGETAMGPLPGGLFGSRHGTAEGINPVTHQWVDGRAVRRPLSEAKTLLAEAGYPDGRDAKTGKPLVLNYDYLSAATPETRAQLDWMVKQFAKLDVQLEIRATDYNQFQDKVRKGKHQIFWWGWLADYPDAENYLFLLYGPNAKSKFDGENAANYNNPEYDKRYSALRLMDDGPAKQAVIDEMVKLAQQDAVWAWGYFPYSSGAYQSWVHNGVPTIMIRDMARYYRIDAAKRVQSQNAWNQPVYWPLAAFALVLLAVAYGGWRSFRRFENKTARTEPVAVPVTAAGD